MLTIEQLHAKAQDKAILKGLGLTIQPGEVHAIMGPNGAGKSTLGNVLAGRDDVDVTSGTITYQGQDLLDMAPEARAHAGLFMAFQYPVSIPGVKNAYFLKAAVNAHRQAQGLDPLDAFDFMTQVKATMAQVGMSESFLQRDVNDGFSGGEKKRNEVLQMLLLQPSLAILDETDSGLDIDALQTVADGVASLRDEKRSFLVITHYQRLLDYLKPDFVHVLADGKIVRTGDASLALELEAKGYGWLTNEEVSA
jgi:Fe-S cluster assembly ATP-binding protein